MSQYQRILLIADPALKRTPAFERAAALARKTGATLHIGLFDRSATIAAMALLDASGAEQAREAWLAARRSWLDEQARILRGHGLQVSCAAVWAHRVRDEVLAQIAEYRPDLVVKDVAHEPALQRLLLKPLDWHLLRDSSASVLLVSSRSGTLPRRVIAAVDVSQDPAASGDFNEYVIKAALGLSIQCDAELHLAYSFDALQASGTGLGDSVIQASTTLYDQLLALQRDNFQKLVARQGVPEERAHFLFGPPALSLARLAQDSGSDVLVLGTHQRRGIDRLLLGSTAEAVLAEAPCDVLVVKPDTVQNP